MHSLIIMQRINALRAEQANVPVDAEDRDAQLHNIQGRIEELLANLETALTEEAEARDAMVASAAVVGGSAAPLSISEQAFGPRASFKGIVNGFKAAITIPAGPAVTDPTIPGFPDYPRGFADTLVQAPAEGAVTFLQRQTRTNGAAQWKTADGAKPESTYTWIEKTAPLTWVAHHAPISKTQASDWGQLDSIVRTEMMVGLSQAKSREAIAGTNSSGIVGVTNTAGVLTYDPTTDGKDDDTVYDSIRRMATRVLLTSGFFPTHVAMSPQVAEELDLLKGSDKHYLAINVNGQVWSMEIVLDINLTVVDEDEGVVHNGVIVYAPIGATLYTKEADNVEIGLVDDQFINNAYTLLAEGRNALAVRFPDAFCHCADAIETVALPS